MQIKARANLPNDNIMNTFCFAGVGPITVAYTDVSLDLQAFLRAVDNAFMKNTGGDCRVCIGWNFADLASH